MSMIELHRSALEEIIIPYNEFLRSQGKTRKQIIGFVEGKDDPSFYQGHIENYIDKDEWTIKLIEAGYPNGNKDRVLRLLNVIDWNRYSTKQTVFFVDRDLSEFLNENLPSVHNLYVTDMYSIENYIVSKFTLRRVLRELYNVTLPEYEWAIIEELFEDGLHQIKELMSLIIAWYLYLRSTDCKPDFDNIDMSDLVTIDCCRVHLKKVDLAMYIKDKWCMENSEVDIGPILADFKAKDGYNKFIRGKNLMWFFINFIDSFCRSCNRVIPSIQTPITGCRRLNLKDAVKDLGPRTKIPESLKAFLDGTCIAHIEEKETEVA
jgi:hypothetical protein